jgi:radical SAM protein with 4Fe4S-binding SPASM domain
MSLLAKVMAMRAARPLRGRRGRVQLHQGERVFVLNPTTMAGVSLDRATAAALGRRPVVLPPGASASAAELQRLGLLVDDDAPDGEVLRAELRRPAWAVPWVDVLFLHETGADVPAALRALRGLIRSARARGPVKVIKFRVCGRRGEGLAERLDVLRSVRALCRREGLPAGVGLGTDVPAEVGAIDPSATDTVFVQCDLAEGGPASGRPTERDWQAIRELAGRGLLVVASITARGLADLRRHGALLRRLARHPLAGAVMWRVAPAGMGPWGYVLGSACIADPGTAVLLRLRRELARLGLRPAPILWPFNLHFGCFLALPGASVLFPDGSAHRCSAEAIRGRARAVTGRPRGAAAGFDPGARSAARLAEQLAGPCRECWALGFCAARCPALPALRPGSGECLQFRRLVRYDLQTSLLTGQFSSAPGKGAPPCPT